MNIALETLYVYPNANYKIAILGDMFELGSNSLKEHMSIIEYALALADEVVVIGLTMQKAAFEIIETNPKANLRIFRNLYEIVTFLCEYNVNSHENIAVLVKASRGMEMERLIDMIKERFVIES